MHYFQVIFEITQLWPRFPDTLPMRPRRIISNVTYLVTRKTTQGFFFLRPSAKVNACIRYCLALAQRRSGVQVHSAVFLSNHYHLVVSDPKGTIPIFTEELNKLLAQALNRLHGRNENFWQSGVQTSLVRLVFELDVMIKTIYALVNPTQAQLVAHGGDWPGVRLFRHGKLLARKPNFFFRRDVKDALPDKLTLTLTPPPIGCNPKLADDVIQAAVTIREKELRTRVYSKGQRFMGAARVRAQNINSSPKRPAVNSGISPRIACRDKWRRMEVLGQLASFVEEHKTMRDLYKAGDKDVVFPLGTYRFVRHFGAVCADC